VGIDSILRRWPMVVQTRLDEYFNALPRPGIVLVHGERAEWIKRPETVADVFVRDLVPHRLRGLR